MSDKDWLLAVGMLRQWLNEEKIKDAKYFVTNEDLHIWLDKTLNSLIQRAKMEENDILLRFNIPNPMTHNYDKGSNTQGYKEGYNAAIQQITKATKDRIATLKGEKDG